MERMDFQQFCDAVRDAIPEYLLQHEIETIHLEKVKHNNGVVHTGLVILKQGEHVSPTIYLEQFYMAMVKQARPFDEILNLIAHEYEKIRTRMEKQDAFTFDLDHIREHVFLRLVNFEKNKEILDTCPYIPFFDMAITFRYLVKMDDTGIASALLHYDNIKGCELSVEELYRVAKENTLRMFPPYIKRLDHFLEERFPQEDVYPEEPELYILSNTQFIYGATMMIFQEVIAQFAEYVGKSMYIIPSSVNEVLLCLTDSKFEKEMLEHTLHEVNELIVSETDYLSDEIYLYDKELGNIV